MGIVPDDVTEAPGAANVITSDDVESLRPYTLHDALSMTPGVRTIDDDVTARRSGIGIRGAPARRSRRTLLLEDGVPINASTYLDPSAHYTPPMERLERVEILRGAGQIMHGPLNNHGMINFRNKQATETPTTAVDLAYGDYDTFKRHLMHTRTVGPVGLVFSYSAMDADGNFDVERFRYDDFFASADWRVDGRQSLAASVTYFREHSNYDESNLLPEEFALAPHSKRNRIYDLDHEFNNFNINYVKVDLNHEFLVSDALFVTTKLFSTDLDRPRFFVARENEGDDLPDIVIDGPTFIPGDTDGGYMVGRQRRYRIFGVDSRMELSGVEFMGLDHTLGAGARYERHRFRDLRPIGLPGEVLNERNRGHAYAVEDVGGYEDNGRATRYDARVWSMFVQDTIRIGALNVIPGVRFERFEQMRDTLYYPGVEGEGLGGLGRTGDRNTEVLPGVTFQYAGIADTQVFASVQKGFSPAIARTAEGFPLLPETGVNTQIGFRTSAIPNVSLEISAFYNRLKNTLVQQSFTVDDLNVVSNEGDSHAAGVDLGVRAHAPLSTGWAVFSELAYNYTLAKFTSGEWDGNRIPEIPLHAGSFTVGAEFAERWRLSASIGYFGAFYSDLANIVPLSVDFGDFEIDEPAVVGKVPSHTLLSARISYAFPIGVTAWLQGRNLTDKLYVSDVENGLRAGAGRTVMAGVRFEF